MANYQPRPTITWKYYSDGNLSIMANIGVDLAANEFLTHKVLGPIDNKVWITISVTAPGVTPPLDLEVPVRPIAPNLITNQVRDMIKLSTAYEVRTSVYKGGNLSGEAINITTSGSHIE